MEPTSEQELKELLEEGKISEDEYRQLLEALHRKASSQPPEPIQPKPQTIQGTIALILMFLGLLLFLLPLCPFLFLGILCEILAFIFGIIGWKTVPGKIAAIGVPCLGLLLVPGLLLLSFVHVARPVTYELSDKHLISLKAYPLDSLNGVLTQDGVVFDEKISSDGKGALRIHANSPDKSIVRLFETGPMEIEDKMLIYSAKLKSQLQDGKAYLEMWCNIPGKGEFFSRGLQNPVAGTTDWTTVQTPFRLEIGQMPANVKLNLVVEGTGTVWLDDIKLLLSPL